VYPLFQESSAIASPGARAFGGMFYLDGGIFVMGGIGICC
jgi:hypothetical protein